MRKKTRGFSGIHFLNGKRTAKEDRKKLSQEEMSAILADPEIGAEVYEILYTVEKVPSNCNSGHGYEVMASKFPLLTREQEIYLSGLIHENKDHDEKKFLAARNALVLCNLRLVIATVGKIGRNTTSILTFEDMMEDGIGGLMRAAERFDPRVSDVRFQTYAVYWIYQHIQKSVDKMKYGLTLPSHAGQMLRKIADDENVSNEKKAQLEVIRGFMSQEEAEDPHDEKVKLNQEVRDFEAEAEFAALGDSIDSETMDSLFLDILKRDLSAQDFRIVYLRAGLGPNGFFHSFEEIGEDLGISEESVRQRFPQILSGLQKNTALKFAYWEYIGKEPTVDERTKEDTRLCRKINYETTDMELLDALFVAAKYGLLRTFHKIVDIFPPYKVERFLNTADKSGKTPLHYATICGHEKMAEKMRLHKANPNIRDNFGKRAAQ